MSASTMAESLPHGHRPKCNPVIYIYIRGMFTDMTSWDVTVASNIELQLNDRHRTMTSQTQHDCHSMLDAADDAGVSHSQYINNNNEWCLGSLQGILAMTSSQNMTFASVLWHHQTPTNCVMESRYTGYRPRSAGPAPLQRPSAGNSDLAPDTQPRTHDQHRSTALQNLPSNAHFTSPIDTVFRKKHPLTFSFISPWVMCRFNKNCSEYT